jgi:manganese/zinc-transporting P-type ATPase C
MRWKSKVEPLLKCKVLHQINGRIRIYCRALTFLAGYEDEIVRKVESLSYVKSARISALTSNILVFYDAGDHSVEQIIVNIEEIITNYSIPAFQRERKEHAQLTVNERRLQDSPVKSLLRNVIAGGSALVWALLSGSGNTRRLPVHQRLTGFTAMSSLALSLPIFKSGVVSLINTKRPNADTLSAAAILASLISGNGISALTIILLADTAELLTAYSMSNTRKAIREMLATGEQFVWKVIDDDALQKVPVEELTQGDKIVVHTGEIISVDGYVLKGTALVDESSITGEFMPKERSKDDKVFAGSTVKSGTITVFAEKTSGETAAAKIIKMVDSASQYKAQVQTMADRFSAQLIPLNFALGALVFLITRSPVRALNMLVIDYSCGIRLSTATALTAAISTGARNGILIKGSNFLEVLAETETLIFDKTGTLTEGNPEVKTIITLEAGVTEKQLLTWAAAAEETSTHPVAHAITEKARMKGFRIPKHSEVEVFVSRGVYTVVNKHEIRVGNAKFMKDNGISLEPARDDISRLMLKGENLVYIAKGERLAGLIGIVDPLRENMKKAINRLRNQGIDDIILLTGDVEQQAEMVAFRMMFDRFKSELMPEDKARFAINLQSKGLKVVMIGDGINDAPALAYADVGIALGSKRTDIAMEAADITIRSDNPLAIPTVIRLSRSTMSIIKQNFATSIGVNSIGLVLGAMGVLPVFWGAFVHNMTTVAVVMNSLRLFFFDVDKK